MKNVFPQIPYTEETEAQAMETAEKIFAVINHFLASENLISIFYQTDDCDEFYDTEETEPIEGNEFEAKLTNVDDDTVEHYITGRYQCIESVADDMIEYLSLTGYIPQTDKNSCSLRTNP